MNVSVKKNKKQVAIAMMITMLLLAGSFIFAQAAPVAQDTVATMSLPMAIIIGLMYYITQSPFLANLGFTVFYRPLIAGTLVGIVMGHPAEGIAIGANINVLYLGWISAGGSLPGDPQLGWLLGYCVGSGKRYGHRWCFGTCCSVRFARKYHLVPAYVCLRNLRPQSG